MKSIGIIGAGISGLSLAFWLIYECQVPGRQITIFERSGRVGGLIETFFSPSGQLYEKGPRSIRASGEVQQPLHKMVSALSLTESLIFPQKSAAKRYCLLDGVPAEIPSCLFDLIKTPIGRKIACYLLLEPFTAYRRAKKEENETLFSWGERFFPNDRVMRSVIGAYTAGIWAADSEAVCSKIALPMLSSLEKEERSLLVHAIYQGWKKWKRGKKSLEREENCFAQSIFSFTNGMQMLPNRLLDWLLSQGVTIQYRSEISNMAFHGAHWVLETHFPSKGDKTRFYAERVFISVDPMQLPLSIQTTIDRQEWYQEESSKKWRLQMNCLPYRASLASVSFGWGRRVDWAKKEGFGVLASKEEDPQLLGIVFDSNLFQEQERTMKTRMTVMVGGTRFPKICNLNDEELVQVAQAGLQRWLGIADTPDEIFSFSFSKAIAVPAPGYGQLPAYIQSADRSVYLLSAAISGVSIANCISSAQKTAKSFLANRVREC